MSVIKKILYSWMILFVFTFNAAAQCAMCKAAAESDLQNNPNSVAKGINSGILFLMVIPYILIFLFFRKEIISFFKEKIKK
ncbi:MAG: hypothetical protein N2203_07120 [Bacteroidia bacterium]|nr:hypothetical protein [Bacteroidia bacterium]